VCGPWVILFTSPDPKGHVRYCHHLESVVIVHKLLHFIFFSESTGPIRTKFGRNVHWIVPTKIYVFFAGQKDTRKKWPFKTGVKKGVSTYMGINYLFFMRISGIEINFFNHKQNFACSFKKLQAKFSVI
jgi:hypothetical protein